MSVILFLHVSGFRLCVRTNSSAYFRFSQNALFLSYTASQIQNIIVVAPRVCSILFSRTIKRAPLHRTGVEVHVQYFPFTSHIPCHLPFVQRFAKQARDHHVRLRVVPARSSFFSTKRSHLTALEERAALGHFILKEAISSPALRTEREKGRGGGGRVSWSSRIEHAWRQSPVGSQ